MDQKELENLLTEGAAQLGITLSPEQLFSFKRYIEELKAWGKKINLFKRANEKEIIIKDFLDSLSLQKWLNQGSSLLDLGSGAGFPGVPLKIARPDLKVTLLEATIKKVYFLKNLIRQLGLTDIEVFWTEKESEKASLSSFDFVISRAFGSLLKFSSSGIMYLKPEGTLLAMKGQKGEKEGENYSPALSRMGLKIVFLERFLLPFLGQERIIIGLKQEKSSP